MKVILASSIFLLACFILLPSDVNCQRHAREEDDDYEIKHYRKRNTPIANYFQGANLKKVCGICHHKYDINLPNCISGKREARYKCLLIAKDNQKFFESRLTGKTPPKHPMRKIVKRAASLAAYFRGENLAKVCAICHSENDIDEADCVSGSNKAKYKCMVAVKKNRQVFEQKMSSGSNPAPAAAAAASTTVPTGDEYFTPENVPKTCKICKIFQVDPDECLANADGEARRRCKNMVAEMPNTAAKQWKKLPGNADKVGRISKRSAALKVDYFSGQNLPNRLSAKVCDICQKYYGINETDCIQNRQRATDECRKRVKENPQSFQSNWTNSNSSAVGQQTDDFGSAENVQTICSFCDEQFNFDFKDCVADRNDVRQECKKWIVWLNTVIKNLSNNQTGVPGSPGRASVAFSNRPIEKRQKNGI